jgi:hypothetical protein
MGAKRKGDTKRQHYVPRMILKRFSKDRVQVSLFVFGRGKRVDGASLRDQCYADYFYGADNVIEKSFAAEETKIGALLGDLSRERLDALTDADFEQLRNFVRYQHARTKGAAEHLSNFAGAFAKQILRDSLKLNKDVDVTEEELDEMRIGLTNAQNNSVWEAAKSLPLFLDMRVKFIATDRSPGFVIGDHPVATYNQFVEDHPLLRRWPTSSGLALKGLQLFMPLSPSMSLAIYDPGTYEYGGRSAVCRAGPKDVAFMNQMQAINALTCIYFDPDRIDDASLASLEAVRRSHPSVYEKKTAISEMRERANGKKSRLVAVYHDDIRLGAKLSFIRPTDGRSYEGYEGASPPIRSPQLVAVMKQYGDFLERKAKEKAAERRATASADDPEDEMDEALHDDEHAQ